MAEIVVEQGKLVKGYEFWCRWLEILDAVGKLSINIFPQTASVTDFDALPSRVP